MMARHVMVAWYMCSFEIFYGIWTSIAKKTIFVIFQVGGSGPSPWGYHRMTVRCLNDFMGPAKASCGDLVGSLRLSQQSTIIFGSR